MFWPNSSGNREERPTGEQENSRPFSLLTFAPPIENITWPNVTDSFYFPYMLKSIQEAINFHRGFLSELQLLLPPEFIGQWMRICLNSAWVLTQCFFIFYLFWVCLCCGWCLILFILICTLAQCNVDFYGGSYVNIFWGRFGFLRLFFSSVLLIGNIYLKIYFIYLCI